MHGRMIVGKKSIRAYFSFNYVKDYNDILRHLSFNIRKKKGKLREIIDDGLWPFKGNHFCLETDRFLLNLACLFLS